ncbi:hypothetical protein FB446DRAFT_792026 [Lentinula raphanica]|nr:hypothetical protein FB446DRAFT_792026 [Lentinula raphanica]
MPKLQTEEGQMGRGYTKQGTVANDPTKLFVSVDHDNLNLQSFPGVPLPPGSSIAHETLNVDHIQVAAPVVKQKGKQMEYVLKDQDGIVRRNFVNPPRWVSATRDEQNLRHHEDDDSVSWVFRNRRRTLRQTPYFTRSKSKSDKSSSSSYRGSSTSPMALSSEDQTSLPMASSSEDKTSLQMAPSDCKDETSPSSSNNDTHVVQGALMAHSSFGYTAFDYHERKVKYKEAYTSWYTYSTSFPIDNPPELPHNAVVLQDNVIFMHINETQKAKYPQGPLSKVLKYCVSMWIWNGGSSKWERINVGERRIVQGYKLCLSVRFQETTHPQWVTPQWVTPKAAKTLLTNNS